jgi:hypothetical protein
MTAPVPKTADGKPDLSGVWLGDQWSPAGRRPNPPGGGGRGGGTPEMLPWAQKVFDERRATSLRDDPEARCMPQGVPKASTLPYPFEIVNASNKTLILFEMYSLRRQIFTDGRELPKDAKDYAGVEHRSRRASAFRRLAHHRTLPSCRLRAHGRQCDH